MRLLWLLILTAGSSWACSCVGVSNPCSSARVSNVIFVARVITDSGEGYGSGPARVAIEEALLGVPNGLRETTVETSSGNSCYFRLRAGERYVIMTNGPQYSVHGCSSSFRLKGKEHILEALRNQVNNGPARLTGTVRKSTGQYARDGVVPGASVALVADNGERLEATSNEVGGYTLSGLAPGRYRFEVAKPGYVPDTEYNRRWSGRLAHNVVTNRIEPVKDEPDTVLISDRSCTAWDVSLWPAGKITGTVRGSDQKPLAGIEVQAFGFDDKNRRESTPIRTGKSDANGVYAIEPLPPGRYVIGVNGHTYHDLDAYSPTFDAGGQAIPLGEGATRDMIDLTLGNPRTPATLRIKVIGPDGQPQPRANASVKNLAGVQRVYSRKGTNAEGEDTLPVYVGESYIVEVIRYVSQIGLEVYQGEAQLVVRDVNPSVTIVLERRSRR